jgi:hypothetical protein
MRQTLEGAPVGHDYAAAGPLAGERTVRAKDGGRRRFGLVAWFLVLSLLSVSLVALVSAVLLSRFLTERMVELDTKLTTEFVNHMFGRPDDCRPALRRQ